MNTKENEFIVVVERKKDIYCSYCGEKFTSGEFAVIIQHDFDNTEIRHPECKDL